MGVFVVVARIRWVWVFRGGGSCGFRGGGWDQVGVGRSSCFVDFFFFFLSWPMFATMVVVMVVWVEQAAWLILFSFPIMGYATTVVVVVWIDRVGWLISFFFSFFPVMSCGCHSGSGGGYGWF